MSVILFRDSVGTDLSDCVVMVTLAAVNCVVNCVVPVFGFCISVLGSGLVVALVVVLEKVVSVILFLIDSVDNDSSGCVVIVALATVNCVVN